MVAGVWLALAFGFLAALLALRVPHLRPPPPPGAASLSLAGLFHDLIRYGKTKNGYGKRPACLQRLDVPKRWFWHFYVEAVIWHGFLLLLLIQSILLSRPFPMWLQDLLSIFEGTSRNQDGISCSSVDGAKSLSAFLVCLLIWLNSCRRLKECLHISVFSEGVMHVAHYSFGLCYYVLVGLTVLCQVPAGVRKGKDPRLTFCWYHALGILLFVCASVHQHRCHVILANLRKNKSGKIVNLDHSIPFGDWFEMVSCPHYFAELLIYISMAVTFGCNNVTWWLVVTYVFFNQAVSAVLCHEFYHSNFSNYPKHRKTYIPFLF